MIYDVAVDSGRSVVARVEAVLHAAYKFNVNGGVGVAIDESF